MIINGVYELLAAACLPGYRFALIRSTGIRKGL
jgi:hypothetical protein